MSHVTEARAPALVANNAAEVTSVVNGRIRTVEKILVVGAAPVADVMAYVTVNWNDVNVTQSDVDPDSRLAKPEKIGHLL